MWLGKLNHLDLKPIKVMEDKNEGFPQVYNPYWDAPERAKGTDISHYEATLIYV